MYTFVPLLPTAPKTVAGKNQWKICRRGNNNSIVSTIPTNSFPTLLPPLNSLARVLPVAETKGILVSEDNFLTQVLNLLWPHSSLPSGTLLALSTPANRCWQATAQVVFFLPFHHYVATYQSNHGIPRDQNNTGKLKSRYHAYCTWWVPLLIHAVWRPFWNA